MCAGAGVWSRIGAVVYGVSQEDIDAYGLKQRHRILQVAGLFGPVPADFREGQSPHSCFWRISAARMPETFQLPAGEAVAVVFRHRLRV